MPKVGLLSDSHGWAETTRRGVAVLLSAGAEVLIHLGDVGGVEVIDALIEPTAFRAAKTGPTDRVDVIEAHLVFGNTDHDRSALARYARGLGVVVDDPVGWLDLTNETHDAARPSGLSSGVDYAEGSGGNAKNDSDGKSGGGFGEGRHGIAFMHGHVASAMTQALKNRVSYLCHGHTHKPRDERVSGVRVINPGALCRAARYTVALLDTRSDDLRFYEIEPE